MTHKNKTSDEELNRYNLEETLLRYNLPVLKAYMMADEYLEWNDPLWKRLVDRYFPDVKNDVAYKYMVDEKGAKNLFKALIQANLVLRSTDDAYVSYRDQPYTDPLAIPPAIQLLIDVEITSISPTKGYITLIPTGVSYGMSLEDIDIPAFDFYLSRPVKRDMWRADFNSKRQMNEILVSLFLSGAAEYRKKPQKGLEKFSKIVPV